MASSEADSSRKRKRAGSSGLISKRELAKHEATFIDRHGNLLYKVDPLVLPADSVVQEWYRSVLQNKRAGTEVYFLQIKHDHRNCGLTANEEITVQHCLSGRLFRCKIDTVQTRPFSEERGHIILSDLTPLKASRREKLIPCPNGLELPELPPRG